METTLNDKTIENEIRELSDEDISKFIFSGSKIILFYMPDSNPSEIQEVKLREKFEIYKDKISFGLVNVYENSEYVIKNNIHSFPSTLFFKGGEVLNTMVGASGDIESSIGSIL